MDYRHLLQGCLSNDRIAQTELYDRYVDILGNTSLRYASSKESAKDILQEAFIKIFKNLRPKYHDEAHFEAWMKRIVINTALNQHRSEMTYRDSLLNGVHNFNQRQSVLNINNAKLLLEIKKLPLIYQHCINLIIVDDYSHKEAAEILQIEESSSRARYSRAISMLRNQLSTNKEIKCDGR